MASNPKFTVLYEKLRGKTFEIDKPTMSIGRKEGVDIVIPDPSLSSHHADIIRSEANGSVVYTLRDNGSTNGTRVNNVPVTEQVLKNSDVILFGMVEVLFDGVPGETSDDYEQQTHTIDISSMSGSSSTTQTLINFNPLAAEEERKHAMVQKIMMGVVGLLVLGVIGAIVMVAVKLFTR